MPPRSHHRPGHGTLHLCSHRAHNGYACGYRGTSQGRWAQVYGGDHWYYQWGAFVFVGLLGGVGVIYYLVALRGRPASVLAEHRAADEPAGIAAGGEEA
jgi:hypothetical protein